MASSKSTLATRANTQLLSSTNTSYSLHELKANVNALHNTQFKLQERKQMKEGIRPEGCQYCWNVEDAPNPPEGGRLSDRHYRSSEWWVKEAWDESS